MSLRSVSGVQIVFLQLFNVSVFSLAPARATPVICSAETGRSL